MILAGNQLIENVHKKALMLILTGAFCLSFTGCDMGSEKAVEFVGGSLGTTYSVKITNLPPSIDELELHQEIKEELKSIESSMSVYDEDSEITKFNQLKTATWFDLSPEMYRVVQESLRISLLTGGAFDFTLGEVINLWGFGNSPKLNSLPSETDIERALMNSGIDSIIVSDTHPAVRKENPNISLNLSAIAKGYAVDRTAQLLDGKGLKNFLVEIGGEIRTNGQKNGTSPWMIAIEKPDFSRIAIHKVIPLVDRSMATSGDYRNVVELAGNRYSHTIDPKTGRPVENSLASVTVVHESCMTADALATALMVLGLKKGVPFAEHHGLAVLWIERKGDELIETTSGEFRKKFSKVKRENG